MPLRHQTIAPKASIVFLPPGAWTSILDCLCDRFPAVSRAEWLDRFARERVLDSHGIPLTPETSFRAGLKVQYFREVAHEPEIPFVESILYEDEHLLVADKPHFLPVVPGGQYVQQTLLSRLIHRTGNADLQPLHRLDRHTAGLVLFSQKKSTRGLYQALFREQTIDKSYEAIAPALPHLEFPLRRQSRIERGESFFLSQETDGPFNAETHIHVLEKGTEFWRYHLKPVSGKKHQLRLHLAALGAPIRYDAFYPQVRNDELDDHAKPLQLLAKQIQFVDPVTHIQHLFTSPQQLKL